MRMRRLIWVFLCALVAGCAHEASTSESPYDELFHKRFALTNSLYLIRSTTEPGFSYLAQAGTVPAGIPGHIDAAEVHRMFDHFEIVAIVSAGSTLEINGATHEVQVSSGQSVSLIADVSTADGGKVADVLTEFIQIERPDSRPNPAIDPQVARQFR